MDRGACWATVHGVAKSQTGLSNFTHFVIGQVVFLGGSVVKKKNLQSMQETQETLV